jgi:hypothetical protein
MMIGCGAFAAVFLFVLALRASHVLFPGVGASKFPSNPAGTVSDHRRSGSNRAEKSGSLPFVCGSRYAGSSDEAETRLRHETTVSFRNSKLFRHAFTLSSKSLLSASPRRNFHAHVDVPRASVIVATVPSSLPGLGRRSGRDEPPPPPPPAAEGRSRGGNQLTSPSHASQDLHAEPYRREDDLRTLDIMKFGASTLGMLALYNL